MRRESGEAGEAASGSESRKGPGREPVRTCVACRRSDGKVRLLRVVADPAGRIRIDHLRREPGRGAYVHPTDRCISLLLRKRDALGKALRRNVVFSPATLDALSRLGGLGDDAQGRPGGDHGQRKGNEEA